jgi:hypothetical protein
LFDTMCGTIIPGDTCVMRVPKGKMLIVLPDGERMVMNDMLVRIVGTWNFRGTPMYEFQPIPWTFPEGAYPDRWRAVTTYFERVV